MPFLAETIHPPRPAAPGRQEAASPRGGGAGTARLLTTSVHLDFGAAGSPAAWGYTEISLVAYSPAVGYGWTSLSGLSAVVRSPGNALTAHFQAGQDNTFQIDLPNGTYDVRPTLGDSAAATANIAIQANGVTLASGLNTAAGQFIRPAYEVQVQNGSLDLRFIGAGGPYFALDGLDVSPAPVASAGPAVNGNEGTPITFSGSATSSSSQYHASDFYSWTFGDGGWTTGTLSPTHTYADSGTYTATLTVTDALGMKSASTTQVTVNNLPPAGNPGGPYTGNAGVPLTFQATATDPSPVDRAGGFTFAWNFGDGTSGAGANPAHTYAAPGTYAVTLTVNDKDGDSSSSTTSATVAPAITALYVSTQGSDANNGLTAATPFRNIATALAHVGYGTTVYVAGGTYYEHLVTTINGAAGQPITLTSYNGTAVIDGSTQNWVNGSNQNQGVIELRNPYYVLQNLKVVNSENSGIVLGAGNLTVTGSEVAFTQDHAITTDTRFQTASPGLGTMIQNITLTNNLIHDDVLMGLGYGQAVSLIADGFLVSGNTVTNNHTEGIDIWLGSKDGEVAGNQVSGNGAAGIYVDGAAYVRIDANTVFGNQKGIGVSSESANYSTHDIWVYNNVIYNQTLGAGLFIWDNTAVPGHAGPQNVLLTNNTLVNNATSIYLHGDSNTAQIMNNLVYTAGGNSYGNIYNDATNSTFAIHNNVFLTSLVGFVSPSTNNYQLTSSSPAIDQGAAIPSFSDDLGNTFTITTDAAGMNRGVNGAPDAGAYEYQ